MLVVLAVAGSAITVPRAVSAQWVVRPAGVHGVRAVGASFAPAARGLVAEVERPSGERAVPRPRAAPYVWGGAAVGVLALAAGLAIYARHTDTECLCNPFAFAPAVAGAAMLGAGAGYVVYRVAGRR